ncbi:TetR/AcrR family transcriptional regulator [Nitratiruptor sp. YY09-18]|uniref:TetR/AcrR family transcriptional regulator n=1 Tax=Nitratiruptor sp. YY09-18 TaxID=2724901 RepID=UPI001916297C|nr:TetR/AcrR family transcriptional regulator [Nitratiruptor sp. YY09-18]BCD68100.1 transcriptional regulator, TetR family [Nitratiruptor sp. YY09-18]
MTADVEKISKPNTTKDKILTAAIELMAEGGYSGASMRKIARKVGIRESAIYNHFKNKDEIFQTIMQQLFSNPFEDFFQKKPIEEYAPKGKRYLYEYAATIKLLTFDPKNEKLFRIILAELLHNKDVRKLFLKYFYDENIKQLSKAFFIMMQNGLIRSADPMLMAQEFFAPFLYWRIDITLLRIDEESTQHLSTIFEKHVDFFWENVAL